jgi:hypothetical protein
VDAALSLAQALASSVEDLFVDTAGEMTAALGGPLPEGVPLRIGRVAGRLVAADLPDRGIAGAGWAKPDGVVEDGRLRLFSGATPAGFVLAGCDPAIGVAEAMLQGLGSRSLLTISAPTGAAHRALACGRVHAAVVHGRETGLPVPSIPVTRVHLACWRVGVGVAPGVRQRSLESLLSSGVAIAQRDPDATSQQAFERAAAAAGFATPGSGPRAEGHIDAARIAAMLGTAAVTNEAAAHAFGLRFCPLELHTVEIWYSERWLDHPGLAALQTVLSSRAFTDRVAMFGGYDLAHCGDRV